MNIFRTGEITFEQFYLCLVMTWRDVLYMNNLFTMPVLPSSIKENYSTIGLKAARGGGGAQVKPFSWRVFYTKR